MNRFRRLVALTVLPLWAVVMVHCGLELNGLFGAPVHSEKTSNSAVPVDADTDPEGGGAIENGHFDSHIASFAVPQPSQFVHWVVTPLDLVAFDPAPDLFVFAEFSHPPPELARCWSFERRAAPSPRAPALLS